MMRRVWAATSEGTTVEGKVFRVYLDLQVYTTPERAEGFLYGMNPQAARDIAAKLIAAADAAMLSGSGMVRDE